MAARACVAGYARVVAGAPSFDLQCHSTHSDGALEPAAVVARAAQSGVTLLALTDHDSVGGIDEALTAAARLDIELVPAVELSAVHEDREDLHLLGYRIDHRDSALRDALEAACADRGVRAAAMAAALGDCGLEVSLPPANGRPIGRLHIAAAAYEHPANAARLAAEGIASASALLEAVLIPGRPARRPRTHPTVAEAIARVRAAGGVAG